MSWVGDFLPGEPVQFPWSTNAKTGGSLNRSVAGAVRVYRGNGTTEWTANISDLPFFDAVVGLQLGVLDTSDSSFYIPHADYFVALAGSVVDGEPVNGWLAHFSIMNRGAYRVAILAVVSGAIQPTVNRILVDGVGLPTGRLRQHEILAAEGSSTPMMKAVIATHTLSSGRADLTFTSNTDTAFVPGDRVIIG